MADTVKILKPNLLVVEGHDDELFFNALVKHLNLGNIQALPISEERTKVTHYNR